MAELSVRAHPALFVTHDPGRAIVIIHANPARIEVGYAEGDRLVDELTARLKEGRGVEGIPANTRKEDQQ